MSNYKYKAVDKNGKYVKGAIAAQNQMELEEVLKESGLELLSYHAESDKSLFDSFSKVTSKDLISLFSQLEQLDKAGISIIDSLQDVVDSIESEKMKSVMREVYEAVKNGSLLSNAMSLHANIFDSVFVGLIETGEKTGSLHKAFASIIDHLKWSADMKRKTVKAIRYPTFSLVVMLIVMGIMTTFVVPKVTNFLEAQSLDLPAMTVALIGFSDFVRAKGVFIVLSIPLIILAYKVARAGSVEFSTMADRAKLKLPIFGAIIVKIEASRFCHFFSITFNSGLGVLECLETSRKVIDNLAIKDSIEEVKQQVAEGISIALAISNTGHFPSMVTRMFKIGEDSGNMENALANIKFFYDREVNDSIEKLVGMIQPTLTFVMGGMMGWITVAVFGPIYGSFSNLR